MTHSHVPKCRQCGYELTGLPPISRCPECGQSYNLKTKRGVQRELDEIAQFEKRFRRGRTIILGALSAIIAIYSVTIRIRFPKGHGWAMVGLVSIIVALMAVTSYFFEKD